MAKHTWKHQLREFFTSLRVGFFLAVRELRHANAWSTGLIIFIMMLTFLNLIVVRGLLVGLVGGVRKDIREHYIGDIFISALEENDTIENAPLVLKTIQSISQVKAVSARYRVGGSLEANYKTRLGSNVEPNQVSGIVFGIDPLSESAANELNTYLFAGEYLEKGDVDQVMVGTDLLRQYSIDGEGLDNVEPGTTLLLTIRGTTREVTVKGILKSKVDTIGSGIYLTDEQVRQLLGRSDYGYDEMTVRLYNPDQAAQIKEILSANGLEADAKIETYEEGEPAFVQDITNTFSLLANIISGISLVVASITTFIIIFVNAITQRQLIGIMKGIGINWLAIVSSYVIQAWFYAVAGTVIATAIIFGVLVPYVAQHPIDFPFSDGILLVSVSGTIYRATLLLVATSIAGFVPAKMIVNKNTLDSILGR